MEIFKEIKGFEDYEVSNHGNVRSLKRDRILKPKITRGYYYVTLCEDGKKHDKRVNRLVAIAFIPNPHNLPCVNHKDENPSNNHVDNLEWCTYKYNSNYGTRNERIAENLKGIKRSEETKRKMSERKKGIFNNPLKSKAVVAIDNEGNVVYEFVSTADAGRNGFKQPNVSACCNKYFNREGNNYYKGYRWFWKSEWEEMQQATHDRVACGKLNIE